MTQWAQYYYIIPPVTSKFIATTIKFIGNFDLLVVFDRIDHSYIYIFPSFGVLILLVYCLYYFSLLFSLFCCFIPPHNLIILVLRLSYVLFSSLAILRTVVSSFKFYQMPITPNCIFPAQTSLLNSRLIRSSSYLTFLL